MNCGTDLFLKKLLRRRCCQYLMPSHRAIGLCEKADKLVFSQQGLEGRNPDVTSASKENIHRDGSDGRDKEIATKEHKDHKERNKKLFCALCVFLRPLIIFPEPRPRSDKAPRPASSWHQGHASTLCRNISTSAWIPHHRWPSGCE